MAYNGTTASSTVINPPILIGGKVGGAVASATTGGTGAQLWLYNSSNGTTEAFTANYITDAKQLGMKAGDVMIQVGCTGSTVGLLIGVIGAVSTSGAAFLSTGSMISSTFG